ncbi:MAG: hypothetical protein RLZZ387_507 [Chloroflexota bacterium]
MWWRDSPHARRQAGHRTACAAARPSCCRAGCRRGWHAAQPGNTVVERGAVAAATDRRRAEEAAAHQRQALRQRDEFDGCVRDIWLLDHQASARRQHAHELAHRARCVGEVVECVNHEHAVTRAVGEGQPLGARLDGHHSSPLPSARCSIGREASATTSSPTSPRSWDATRPVPPPASSRQPAVGSRSTSRSRAGFGGPMIRSYSGARRSKWSITTRRQSSARPSRVAAAR